MNTFHIPRPDADTLGSTEVKKPSLFSSLSFGKTELSNSFRKVVSSGTRNKFGSTLQSKFNQHSKQTPALTPLAQSYDIFVYARAYTVNVTAPTQKPFQELRELGSVGLAETRYIFGMALTFNFCWYPL